MLYHINQLRDFSSLFTRKEVKRWLKEDFKSIDIKLERYNLIEKNKGNLTFENENGSIGRYPGLGTVKKISIKII
ncbi:hypothetical protein SAMN05880574_12156 [Chryseobacterium sp. RU37D]|uniref:hypothetical protein n=1 Tax=Chryseobacterium sp. RU37D TaxID=1907397 RepID=UPI00095578B7|nr:hypothetical protein [Chryseobacterium sp. RU37D]SIQ70146.1 hypothetical protein SAMN05880574_12156 [Chryseobacterium sp. RU37D]